jgi:3-deoxy-D-manno-octulosonic-acid transferase
MRLLYSALFYALTPFVLGRLAWRGRKLPAYRERWPERFARYDFPPEPGSIWFHAVSVGEAEAAFPLIRQFQARFPDRKILVTCTTPTGSERVRAVLGDAVRHVYLPYDLPDVVGRFMDHFRPALAVILETEIWPSLYRECARRGIPLAIVNARLSEKSARRYRKISGLTAESLAAVSLIAAQTPLDAERYAAIGADPAKTVVTGNVKFDLEFSEAMREQATRLRAELFGARPVWIAGSTHPGEEEQILAARRTVREKIPGALLALAPRHPDRFEEVMALCVGAGLSVRRRSERQACDDATEVFLIDSLGELRLFYAASDLAFVGGSLVPRGGHNVLEPAAAGCPVLFGPHMFNFAEIAERLMESGGGQGIADGDELAERVARLLSEPETRREIGGRGSAFVNANRGAMARVADLLAGLLQVNPVWNSP